MTRPRLTLGGLCPLGLASLLLVSPQPSAAQDPVYELVDLGSLEAAYPSSYPYALNEKGEVAGVSAALEPNSLVRPIAFLYSEGPMRALHPLDQAFYSWAYGLNNLGDVVGGITPARFTFPSRAFLYSAGTLLDLHSLLPPGASQSWAKDVNDAGQIVGETGGFPTRAFLLDAGRFVDVHEEVRRNLGGSVPWLQTTAAAVNGAGQVVGSLSEGANWTAFTRRPDGTVDLLLPVPDGDTFATSVNEAGQIAGSATSASNGGAHAIIWKGASVQDLGTLGTGFSSTALGINSWGEVVGVSDTGDYDCPSNCFPVQRAFLFRDGFLSDLNDLIPADSGWVLAAATTINDAGQIVASGRQGLGHSRAVLLTPRPAPRLVRLIELVRSFDLPKGTENSLVKKLENALASLNAGRTDTACNQLQAFINETRAQAGKALTADQADRMIREAEAIRAQLGCA